MSNHHPKISILIPVYNGMPYLKQNIECLLQQTLKDIEIICIDDFSTDDSVSYLESISKQDNRLKLIRRTSKGGNAIKGIVYGLPYCNGDYFFYTSQDDFMDSDCLELLYNKAVSKNADIVVPDMIYFYENRKDNPGIFQSEEAYLNGMSGQQAFIKSLNWSISGMFLQKMSFARQIGWDDMFYNSCEYATRTHLYHANKVEFVKTKFFYRQDNSNALTKQIKPFTFECLQTSMRIIDFQIQHQIPSKIIRKSLLRLISEYKYFVDKANEYRFTDEDNIKIQNILKQTSDNIFSHIKKYPGFKLLLKALSLKLTRKRGIKS